METLKTKVRPVLMGLEVGETVVFPIEKMKTVRTQASEIGAIHNRLFTTSTSRIERTITVTRKPLPEDNEDD